MKNKDLIQEVVTMEGGRGGGGSEHLVSGPADCEDAAFRSARSHIFIFAPFRFLLALCWFSAPRASFHFHILIAAGCRPFKTSC